MRWLQTTEYLVVFSRADYRLVGRLAMKRRWGRRGEIEG